MPATSKPHRGNVIGYEQLLRADKLTAALMLRVVLLAPPFKRKVGQLRYEDVVSEPRESREMLRRAKFGSFSKFYRKSF